jgi:hypothetical protein
MVGMLLALSGRSGSLAEPRAFSFAIDPDLRPEVDVLPGIGGRPERPVAAVVEPGEVQGDFVADEVILLGPTPQQLDDFAGRYAAEVVFGDTLPEDPGNLPPDKLRPEHAMNDDYLLRVELSQFDFDEETFIARMEARDHEGFYLFSSEQAVQLLALVLHEQEEHDLEITLNPLMLPPELPVEAAAQDSLARTEPGAVASPASADCVMCQTEEYPISGGHANGFSFGWLNDAGLKATRAWQFYDLLGYTPGSPPVLAMVDFGFALNDDFPPTENVPQYDFINDSHETNGYANTYPTGGKWHGTGTLGIAAARLNNQFGTAGTGGQAAYPYLFRPEGTLYGVARAVRTAVKWGADVVNISAETKGANIFELGALVKASNEAAAADVIVLVTAGNNADDASNHYPCNTPGLMCVGGVDMTSKKAHGHSNYGSRIDVWGPYDGVWTTPNPDSSGVLTGASGTCAASAYVAGVVTLMKAVNPGLDYPTTRSILQTTANPSTDPKLTAAGGYLNAYGAVREAAQRAGRYAQGDSYEPNDSPGSAATLSPGTTTATIAPGDTDTFAFQTSDLVDLQLRVSYEDEASPGNGLNARLDGSWGTTSGGTITLDQSFLTPGQHELSIWGQQTDTINCYHTALATSASGISPDAYDDQTPAGEPRNDTFAHRAVIPGTVGASVLIPKGQIVDLNFDVVNDIDVFEVTLAPEVDPKTGDAECIGPGHPDYGREGFTQGRVEVSAWPDGWTPSTPGYDWPFELTVHTATGSVFTSTTGLRLAVECPHQHFPNGKIRFSLRAQDGRRNFYRVFIHYSRWNVHYDVPPWVWEQTEPPLLRVLPPWGRRLEFLYPRDPRVIRRWAVGDPPHPMPAEYGVFHWDALRDLDVSLSTQGGRAMEMTLFDAEGEVIDHAAAGPGVRQTGGPGAASEDGHIHIDALEPGTYVLAFEGDFGAVYAVRVGTPHAVYVPMVVRRSR